MLQEMTTMPNRTHAQELVELRTGRPLADVLRDMYVEQGLSQERVAVALGVTRLTIARWLEEFGITRDMRGGEAA